MLINKDNCTKCENKLTRENSYRLNGYRYRQCKDCRNAKVRELARKKAKMKKQGDWFVS